MTRCYAVYYYLNGKAHADYLVLQLCVPSPLIPVLLKELHDEAGHLAAGKTLGKLQQRYYWKNMEQDTLDYCKSCAICAKRKQPSRTSGVPMLSPMADHVPQYGPMQCLAIDVVGPMTTSHGKGMVLTVIDYYTRYGTAIPLARQSTANIVQALLKHWILVHGMPRLIISDNGPGFKSYTMKDVMDMLGIKIHYVSPYHPQSNGTCERLNQTVVNMIASYITDDTQNEWVNFVPNAVFAYNTAVHSSTGYTPYFLAHGREAVIGSEATLSPNMDVHAYPQYVQTMQRNLAYADQHITHRVSLDADARERINAQLRSLASFQPGDQVYVFSPPKSGDGRSAKLMSPYHGPFTVLRATSRVTYAIENNFTKNKTTAHVTRMKPVVPRPAHLASSSSPSSSFAAASAAPADVVVPLPGPGGHTRAQHQTQAQQQQQITPPPSAPAAPAPASAPPRPSGTWPH